MLAVQAIEILWTKATRGAPRALERVALPRAFPVDGLPSRFLLQRYLLAEWKDFEPILVKSEQSDQVPRSEGVLSIASGAESSFVLGILGTPNGGQPRRNALLHAVQLLPEQAARLIVNARHSNYSGQYYSETIYNVALDGHAVPPDRFLRGQPDHEIDLKAHLF